MQYDVDGPQEYLEALDRDWRYDTLQSLRTVIREKGPDLEEGIRYKMLSYSDGDGVVLQLNAQSAYVSLYIGDASKVDEDGSLLEGLDRGKGCIRFKKSTDVAATRIDEFLERALALRAAGVDIDC